MATIKDTAYPQLGTAFRKNELGELFAPTSEEMRFVESKAHDVTGRIQLLTLLKVFQHLGYFPDWSAIPTQIIEHLVSYLGYLFVPVQHAAYAKSGTRARYLQHIRQYLEVQTVSQKTYDCMEQSALETAKTKEYLADIINVMIEELVKQRFELPAFSRFHRIAVSARSQANEACFESVHQQLSEQDRQQLEAWLSTNEEEITSWWQRLKTEAPAPSVYNIRLYLEQVDWLKEQSQQIKVKINLPDAKQQQFTYEAYACDLPHIRQLKPNKRYTFILLLLEHQISKGYDDLIAMFIRRIFRLRNDAKAALEKHHEKSRQELRSLIEHLAQIGTAYQMEGNHIQRFEAIREVMPTSVETMIEQCNYQLAFMDNDYLRCLPSLYRHKRSLLFNCLSRLELQAVSKENDLLAAYRFICKHRSSRKEWIAVDQTLALDWIGDKWRKLVTGKSSAKTEVENVHQKYFELCVFFELARQLETGDLFVHQSYQYSNWTAQLISLEECQEQLPLFELVSNIPTDAEKFIQKVKSELRLAAEQTDQHFPENQHARIHQGKLVLSKNDAKSKPEDYPIINQELKDRMHPVSILQLLQQTEQWLELHQYFQHFSGAKSRIDNYAERLVSTLFCYGCFMTPTQAARSIEGITRKQIAWIHDHHINEQRIHRAITEIINVYTQYQLPQFWGSGKHVSTDGTHWSTYQKNLFSQYHIRYGAYGGVGYYHVSDTYIALFSHFIPCGVYEAVYILDGLIKNKSLLQPDTVHGDTHSQSTVVFGLAYLLGIKLMPRIRDIKKLIFYRPDKQTTYKHIDELFSESINWTIIEKHFEDMLRVVLSIKNGKITPSTILRRFNSKSRKNKLYYAFRELGRAVRTIFLLQYIQDIDLRKIIFAATNKSEEFNQFAGWIAFANKTIPENLRHDQSKIIKYNHLLANLIMLYNVNEMTRIFNELHQEGHDINNEVLDAFAPYRTEHINRFGSYTLQPIQREQPLQHQLHIKAKPSKS